MILFIDEIEKLTSNKKKLIKFNFKTLLINLFDKELATRLSKIIYERRIVVMFDNEIIHKTKEVKLFAKNLGWVVFMIPPYSLELNQIEHTFET